MYRQTLAEIKGDSNWSAAETRLIAEAHTGRVEFSSERPEAKTTKNEIRAPLIAHLILGGCDKLKVPAKGVAIHGAWITSKLDLEGCKTDQPLGLFSCHIEQAPMLRDTRLGGLYLLGSKLPGLDAHRLVSTTNVHLSDGFISTGPVEMVGARIARQLACDDGRFFGNGQTALNCDAIEIGGDVLLRNGFTATGLVNLVRAKIGGNMRCHKGAFSGGIDGEGMKVSGGFFLHDLTQLSGQLNLTDAHVGRLHDDAAAWTGGKPLYLSGFRYDRLTGDMRISERLKMLAQKHERVIRSAPMKTGSWLKQLLFAGDAPTRPLFDPQPHAHLAKTLREHGNSSGAVQVLMDKDRRLATNTFHRSIADLDGTFLAALRAILAPARLALSRAFGAVFGYGHRPGRALWFVLGLWFVTSMFYLEVWNAGQFAPNSDVVLTSADWVNAVETHEITQIMPLQAWLETPSAQDYESFSHWLYAFDVFIPLDALGQETAWAPSPVRGALGWWGFYAKPAIQMLGWIITAIGAAAVTGLVGRRD
jgi:hypothetical protein